jgi:gamma-tubulin complex component 4
MIRDQDLSLTLLRASLGTSAQHDPALSRLKFTLPTGPLRPLLRSLSSNPNVSMTRGLQVGFDDLLLGTPLALSYTLSWPLDLFLIPSDLNAYSALFAYLASIRRAQTIVLECWTSLSNAQRARRRWTVLDEGGVEDGEWRRKLLRCGWGVVREMIWFLDTLWGHIMTDVVDVHFRKLNEHLDPQLATRKSAVPTQSHPTGNPEHRGSDPRSPPPKARGTDPQYLPTLDFATLRSLHRTYLSNLLSGTLLSHAPSAGHIREILEVCDRFVAQVERWGGDILPPLLFEGSLKDRGGAKDEVGKLAKERWEVVRGLSEVCDFMPSSSEYLDGLSWPPRRYALDSECSP